MYATGRIPPELCRIRGLINLYLNDNKLDGCIPPELGDLNELLILHLHNNELHGVIPSQLCKMRNLEELGLRDNNLTGPRSLPEELDRLLNWLSTLQQDHLEWCEGNSWKEPPDAIVHAGLAKVRDYLKDFFAGSCTVRRANVKVVIVGQQSAGKTSLRQSIKEKRPAPTAGPQDSTVQIDVEKNVDLNGVCVNFYDCAGQVAYTGLLQMFLTRRSVAIIVCDAGAFGQREASLDYDAQLDRDVRQLESLRVCDWLRFLSFRIPDSDAILVATKCDLAAGVAPDTAARIERASNRWLRTLANDGMRAVHVEPGVSLTSCVEREERITFFGRALHLIYSLWKVVWSAEPAPENLWPCDWREGCSEVTRPSLLQRIVRRSDGHGLRGAEMALPHSWDIALRVLDALRCGRDPAVVVERHLIAMNGSKVFEKTSVERTKKEYTGITTQELDEVWMDVLRTLSDKNLEVASADRALEGALTIREFEGTLLRHETYVFLDVHWLTTILKPIQNHKDVTTFEGNVSLGDMGDTSLITLTDQKDVGAWERLKNKGVLEPKLAKTIWPGLSDYVLPTLESLGLTFPLARDPAGGLVVLLKLPAERPVTVGKDLEKFRNIHKEIFTASWTFYMGTPPGAIEKVLTRCASIGAIQTFWRFGVLVQGDLSTEGVQGKYVLLVEYDNDKRVLELKVYGKVVTAGPWAALSFGLSAVRTMCKEFPGLRR